MVKVKEDITGWKMWEHGVPDSRLIIIAQANDYVKPSGKREAQWLCECSCNQHKKIIAIGTKIKSGHIKSCGCLQYETMVKNGHNPLCHQRDKKYNQYDLSGLYGIGLTSNTNEEFYFDLEDYDLIKHYTWMIDANGYIVDSDSTTYLHRLVLNCPSDLDVDHIRHNKRDNRKDQVRICNQSQNNMNKGLQNNNTSGYTGVYFHKPSNSWCAYIKINGKQYRRYSKNKDNAIALRIELEDKYFKEFSLYNSMRGENNEQKSGI